VGLVARVFEREGIPTVTLSSALDITRRVKAPRTAFLNFPLGNQIGPPNAPALQKRILVEALNLLSSVRRAGEIAQLPFEWPDPSWQADVVETYRRDSSTVQRQRVESEYEEGEYFGDRECVDVCSLV
jgi:hypothetical protein